MENRRDFFKAIGFFASGIIGARLATYVPKKEEETEKLLVSEQITINHEGKEYHPVVVKKTVTKVRRYKENNLDRLEIKSNGNVGIGNIPPPYEIKVKV